MSHEIEVSALSQGYIKSCARSWVEEIEIDKRGPRFGRHWMVTDLSGVFMLSDKFPRMVLIEPFIDGNKLVLSARDIKRQVEVPINDKGKRLTVEMFEHQKYASIDDGDLVAEWLTDYLGVECRLVHMPEDFVRTDTRGLARLEYADSWSLSLGNEVSLEDLIRRIKANSGNSVPMERFGHDVWVTGAAEYSEDVWGEIRVNSLTVAVVKPIERCARTMVRREAKTTEELLRKDLEPMATLNRYRRIKKPDGSNKVIFGQKMAHKEKGKIHLGDKVEVLVYKAAPIFSNR